MTAAEQLSEYVARTKYARWDYAAGRRETWPESVARYVGALRKLGGGALPEREFAQIEAAMVAKSAFGSMRLLAMAGPAFERDHVCAYNCAALDVDRLSVFHDVAIASMNGAGVTYSVERRNISQLPVVPEIAGVPEPFVVPDTTEGWAAAFDWCIDLLYGGMLPLFDLSLIRKKGALLRTKGGRASGPEPLRDALARITAIFVAAQGRRLTALELSDVFCHIGQASVCGGVRRTALMCLYDWGDAEMRNAKTGEWWRKNPQRGNANFSEVQVGELSPGEVSDYVDAMVASGAGEPGFFNRWAAIRRLTGRRRGGLLEGEPERLLVNPCGEVILLPFQFCNLSFFSARPGMAYPDLETAAILAARMGTLQAAATEFTGLREPLWRENCERERLLGVGIVGYMDAPLVQRADVLWRLRRAIQDENDRVADALDINPAAALTGLKPAGNSSLVAAASSGIHAAHFPYMLRRVTVGDHEPFYHVLRESGVPLEPGAVPGTWYALFPLKAPGGAVTQRELTAVDQMNHVLNVVRNYADHAVSVTIAYEKNEIPDIKKFLFEHQSELTGLTFFDKNTPGPRIIDELTRAEYERLEAEFPVIDWSILADLESEDYTTVAGEVGCAGGACSVDYTAPVMTEVRL